MTPTLSVADIGIAETGMHFYELSLNCFCQIQVPICIDFANTYFANPK